ncbi:hypothetical protein BCR42DRAFT_425828 [Absidia repens]|uniref:Uncharacterized protein n=1 Tax=Absidia repens TaxID=90262 RepID=A0A1X2I219_9FUNG|nr:hypothetical protein BCR42DRAFT_425828 [Absidia repens]
MPELTEQQKLERRRLKRQQRILQSAGNRLEKITGTAFPDRVSPSPSPSTSASSLRPVSTSSTSSISSNRTLRSVSSVPYLQQQQQQPMLDNDDTRSVHGIETAEHFPASNDPRRRTYDTYSRPVMEDIQSATSIPSILLPSSSSSSSTTATDELGNKLASSTLTHRLRPVSASSSFPASTTTAASASAPAPASAMPSFSPSKQRPLSIMNTLLMRRLYRQQHHPHHLHSLDPTLKYWNALHFISMIWLTLCGIHSEWTQAGNLECFARLLHDPNSPMHHFPLFRNFVMIEILLFGAFALYHPKDQYPVPDDDFTLVASQLPTPFDSYMTILLSYRRTLLRIIQDLSIVVFIIGFIQVISKLC